MCYLPLLVKITHLVWECMNECNYYYNFDIESLGDFCMDVYAV